VNVNPAGSTIRLIVGLGNPGPEYERTRHNAGARFVEALAATYHISLQTETKFLGRCGRISINGHDLRLLIPGTFMNLSGQAVVALAGFYKLPPEAILVAHDELDLPVGKARLKLGGGHGGHNGLRDIGRCLGNNPQFYRLRLGIDHPGNRQQVVGYVLGKAPREEDDQLLDTIHEAICILPEALTGSWQKAVQRLHSYQGRGS
jgi:PTH1 family peptidyl-tRNA hydrolase